VFGVPPDLQAIQRVLEGTQATLILDNAHGFGTECNGARCALQPAVQTYSFHATKILPAPESAAVDASDAGLLGEIRSLRNHGLAADPLTSAPGYNAKMSELHAAVALRSLQGLDAALTRRRQYAERLCGALTADGAATFTVQRVPESVHSNFQNLAVLSRRHPVIAVQAELDGYGIETRRYFWPPLHHLPEYRGRFC